MLTPFILSLAWDRLESNPLPRWRPGTSTADLLESAKLLWEKSELKKAQETYQMAQSQALRESDSARAIDATLGLIRLAAESLDFEKGKALEAELKRILTFSGAQEPSEAPYARGILAISQENWREAQKHLRRALIRLAASPPAVEAERERLRLRYLTAVGLTWMERGRRRRAQHLFHTLIRNFSVKRQPGLVGVAQVNLAKIYELQGDLDTALEWYERAQASILEDHDWFYLLYIYLGFARIYRLSRQYSKAEWYLELVQRATQGKEYGRIHRIIQRELLLLEKERIDLYIDPQRGLIRTRERGEIHLRKQFVLLNILKALSEENSGLSKSDLINRVWAEDYRPSSHDNKLYYNINRLRKLIEPDVHRPRYVQNWKEGYRFAPGLKIQIEVQGSALKEKSI